jgi:hypothetical protein
MQIWIIPLTLSKQGLQKKLRSNERKAPLEDKEEGRRVREGKRK